MQSRFGVGRPANPDRSAVRNRVPLRKHYETVENIPFEEGRQRRLPPRPGHPKGIWPERTLRWWDNIRVMPHAKLWEDSDWDFATETAMIHAMFWQEGETKLATELRLRERLMGCTWEARVSAGIIYSDPEPAPLADVTALDAATARGARPAKATPRNRVRAIDPDGA